MLEPGTLRGVTPTRQINQHPIMARRPAKQLPEAGPGSRGAVKVDIRRTGSGTPASGARLDTHRAEAQFRGNDLPPQRGHRGGGFLPNAHDHLLLVVSETDSEPQSSRIGLERRPAATAVPRARRQLAAARS